MATYLNRSLNSPVWSRDTSVEKIDEQTVSRFYGWLVSFNYSHGQHNKVLSFFRCFVEWLAVSAIIGRAPSNLKVKSHRKRTVYKAVKTWNGVKDTVEALPAPYRLWALLGLNCGCTPVDLGSLTWEQIDTTRWILTRRRQKTGDLPTTPTVRYELFPEVIDALKQLPHRTGLLFKTQRGLPMYKTGYRPNGQAFKKDMFTVFWYRLDPRPEIPLGKFRNIGANYLEASEHYRGYVDYFLAHTPKTISQQHYTTPSDEPFFRALRFIREQLGYTD